MGLFDKILKGAVDAIDNAAAKNGNGPTGLKDLFNQAMDKKGEAINGSSSTTASSKPSTATTSSSSKRSNCAYTRPTYTTPQEVLDTASIPAKPSRKIEFEVFDGENAEIRVKVTFNLSGDFLETAGDVHYLASYLPTIDDDYDADYSDSNTPLFGVLDVDDEIICNMAEKFDKGGVPENAMMFLPVNDMGPRARFKAKVENRGKIEYFYYCPLYDYMPDFKTPADKPELEDENIIVFIAKCVGRFGCIGYMCLAIGDYEVGFSSKLLFLIWAVVALLVIALYWVLWIRHYKKGNHFEDIYGTGIPLFIIPAAFVLVTGIFSMNFMLIIFSVLDIVCEYCSAYGVRKRLHPAKTEESSDEAETKENEDGE